MNKKIIGLTILTAAGFSFLSGCGRDAVEIKPYESAFLIPYEGNTKNQTSFSSEEFLKENKVPGKRVIITYDYKFGLGNLPDAILIKVNRTPVTREWVQGKDGSTTKNQGVRAESIESISFIAGFNCTVMIKEEDTAKYLYMYPSNMELSKVMDDEIRAVIGSKFSEECSKKSMSEIIQNKSEILKTVKSFADKHFEARGITISILGYKDDFTYPDKSIQEAINKAFKASKDLEAQENINEKKLSEAEANKKAMEIQAQAIKDVIRLKELENQEAAIKRWNGKMPNATGINGIFDIPIE